MKYYFLLNLICLTKCKIEKLVVEGEIGQIKQFPHSGFLQVMCNKKSDVGWICGSSILNQRILLTAAHCVGSCRTGHTLSASTGHSNRERGFASCVRSVLLHETYNKYKMTNDIALLKLDTDLKFSFKVQRVALMENPPYYENAQVAGWGLVREIDPIQETVDLHYLNQYIWNKSACQPAIHNRKGVFCASSSRDTSYLSRGDSGSALVVRGYIQIGLVSYKMPSISRSLVVYTDTGYYYDWIKKNSKKLYCVIEEASPSRQ